MAEFKENVTYNNEDMEEIADWYQKSNEYYSNRIDNARRYLIALIQQMTVDDNAGNFQNFHNSLEIISYVIFILKLRWRNNSQYDVFG